MNSPAVAVEPALSDAERAPLGKSHLQHKERTTRSPQERTKVGMISLGCAKNLVDAEIMLGSVLQQGMEITSNAGDADVLVINTCAFIDSAKEESIEGRWELSPERGSTRAMCR